MSTALLNSFSSFLAERKENLSAKIDTMKLQRESCHLNVVQYKLCQAH
jgi:hypothetical protein